jgi:hypothetical protein
MTADVVGNHIRRSRGCVMLRNYNITHPLSSNPPYSVAMP